MSQRRGPDLRPPGEEEAGAEAGAGAGAPVTATCRQGEGRGAGAGARRRGHSPPAPGAGARAHPRRRSQRSQPQTSPRTNPSRRPPPWRRRSLRQPRTRRQPRTPRPHPSQSKPTETKTDFQLLFRTVHETSRDAQVNFAPRAEEIVFNKEPSLVFQKPQSQRPAGLDRPSRLRWVESAQPRRRPSVCGPLPLRRSPC